MENVMTRLIQSLRASSTKLLLAAAVATGAMLMPSFASAADHGFRNYGGDHRGPEHRDFDHGHFNHDDHHDFSFTNFGFAFSNPTPAYEQHVDRVWIEPVYQTVCDRVWCAPVVKHAVDRLWVDPIYEDRDVISYEDGSRVIHRERTLVTPGHWEDRSREIVVRPGHWDNVERQVLVSPGHWEDRVTNVAVDRQPSWSFGFGVGR
jgi:hypothetical protein